MDKFLNICVLSDQLDSADNYSIAAAYLVASLALEYVDSATRIHLVRSAVESYPQSTAAIVLTQENLRRLTILGIKESQLINHCGGVFLLGTQVKHCFSEKAKTGEHGSQKDEVFISTCETGADFDGIGFHQYFLAQRSEQPQFVMSDYQQYSLGALMANEDRFLHPAGDKKSILSTLDYRISVNASLLELTLLEVARKYRVQIESEVTNTYEQNKYQIVIDCRKAKADAPVQSGNDYVALSAYRKETLANNTQIEIYSSGTLFREVTPLQKGHVVRWIYPQAKKSEASMIDQFLEQESIEPDKYRVEFIKQYDQRDLNFFDYFSGPLFSLNRLLKEQIGLIIPPLQVVELYLSRLLSVITDEMSQSAQSYISREISQYQKQLNAMNQLLLMRIERTSSLKLSQMTRDALELFASRGEILQLESKWIPKSFWTQLLLASTKNVAGLSPLFVTQERQEKLSQIKTLAKLVNQAVKTAPKQFEYVNQINRAR